MRKLVSSIFNDFQLITYIFLVLDVLIYFDRGILPGLHEEVVEILPYSPEFYFGVLQSTFVAGLALTAPLLAYLSIKFKRLLCFVASGLALWNLSLFGCFLSGVNSFVPGLYFCRALSGVGEAAFASLLVPALVDCQSPHRKGLFLGLFYALMPLGVSAGYVLSSLLPVTLNLSFPAAFGILSAVSLPYVAIVLAISFLPEAKGLSPWAATRTVFVPSETISREQTMDYTPKLLGDDDLELGFDPETLPRSRRGGDRSESSIFSSPTHKLESAKRINMPLFVSVLLSGAAQAAVTNSLAAFGSAFLLTLKIFESEVAASSVMGFVAVCVGALGTFAGGFIMQASLNRCRTQNYRSMAHSCSSIIFSFGLAGSVICMTCPFLLYIKFNVTALVALGLGILLICAVQSSLNLGIMSSCAETHRSLTLSLYTLGIHFLGDVPGPILIGYLKDWASDSCMGDDCGEIIRRNVILVIAFLLSWTIPIWIGGAMALTAGLLQW